ncbi:hypothetical protein MTO96_017830 [Rhipicephalus appendiculatus]
MPDYWLAQCFRVLTVAQEPRKTSDNHALSPAPRRAVRDACVRETTCSCLRKEWMTEHVRILPARKSETSEETLPGSFGYCLDLCIPSFLGRGAESHGRSLQRGLYTVVVLYALFPAT